MSNRDAVLGKLRRALKVDPDHDYRLTAVNARLNQPEKGIIPARGQLDREGRIALFTRQAEAIAASVETVTSYDDLAQAMANWLRAHNRAPHIKTGSDRRLEQIDWSAVPILKRQVGPSDGQDCVAVSHAEAGIAETGTLILISGTDNPTTLNFLPEDHLVVLHADDLVGDMETVWDRLREKTGAGAAGTGMMPRTVNMITGPSRSADIGQKLVLGAHGPQSLHIFIITD